MPTVSSEGRYAQSESASVAWVSDTGPREENQDRAWGHIGVDGSWLIAVADGMGGQPRGREAAIAAIRGLPTRIGSAGEMHAGFGAANRAAAELTPVYLRFKFSSMHLCPAATLCAAVWTPEGGLVVGYAGDTIPVLVWRDRHSWHARALGLPHRRSGGAISLYVGGPGPWPTKHNPDNPRMELLTESDIEPASDEYGVVVMSDGVWEPIVRQALQDSEHPDDPLGPTLAAALGPDDHDASTVAHKVMTAARRIGLDDNATVAVAHVAAVTDSGEAVDD